jgi:hypothetical protein
MSHKATTWAIQLRGIRPATKIVAMQLADCHNPSQGCFPSQEYLVEACEMSRSSLNEHLKILEAEKKIRRVQRIDPVTRRQQSTRYILAFEADFDLPEEAQEPCPETGHGAVSENDGEPCPDLAHSRVRNPDTNLVKEPVKEPERECARERETAFEQARRAWPTGFTDSREEALAAWSALTDEERKEALGEIGRFVSTTKAVGRKFFGTLAAYLAERKWMALPERPKPAAPTAGTAGPAVVPSAKPTAFMLANPHLFPERFGASATGNDGVAA